MTPAPLISLQHVTVERNGTTLVGPVSLDVAAGERVVLLGRSGSGKTSTLRVINRMLELTSGTAVVEGRPTTAWDPVQLRRSIGYMVQDVGLFPHFTVAQNVDIVPRLCGWPADRRRARTTELLDLVGLPAREFGARLPHALSGGQRQRVGVARALAADPPILLCDEPFGALDPVTRRTLQHEFVDLATRLAKTVVFVTHDVEEARAVGHRIVVLADGTLRFDGPPTAFDTAEDATVRALRGAS